MYQVSVINSTLIFRAFNESHALNTKKMLCELLKIPHENIVISPIF